MDAVFQAFATAFSSANGYSLSRTLDPELSAHDLQGIWESTSPSQAEGFIRRGLRQGSSSVRLAGDELQGWVEVYLAYWRTIGELLSLDGANSSGGKVCSDDDPSGPVLLLLRWTAAIMDKSLRIMEGAAVRTYSRLPEPWL
jgi:hypothetical protein